MIPFTCHTAVALVWFFLSQERGLNSLFAGWIGGFILIACFRKLLGAENYVRRVVALFRFVMIFLAEFLRANLSVAQTVLFRSKDTLSPQYFTYDVSGLTRSEILLLSHCITLTPGTTTVEIAPDWNHLILHLLDGSAPDAVREELDRVWKRRIMEFMR